MGDDTRAHPAPSPSGGLIWLQARTADLGSWLGPTWAALCGVLASNAFDWQSGDWLQLALTILLVDAGWGTLWASLASTNWALPVRRWRDWERNRSTPALPYTLPGTPGDRLRRLLGRSRAWWHEVFWPTCGVGARAVLVALPLTVLLAALLGPELILLSGAVLALTQLGVIWEGGDGSVPPGWDGLIGVALPWLAGHATFASVTLPSAGFAALFAMAWGSAWATTSRSARSLVIASQLAVGAWLVALQCPVAAGMLFLLLVPQMALLPWIGAQLQRSRFARHSRPWLMAAMAVAALVL